MCLSEINAAIKAYAEAYQTLSSLQSQQQQHEALNMLQFHPQKKDECLTWLPQGDQKTGVIGEYYAMCYVRCMDGGAWSAKFSDNPSEKGWDIMARNNISAKEIRIQVKTVSAYSKTRAMTPLHSEWDHLYLIHLKKNFQPDGFWILEDDDHTFMSQYNPPITGLKMRDPGDPNSGTEAIWKNPRTTDKFSEICNILKEIPQ